ncbi:MAG: hypothetical protein M3P43_15015 [Actinomycetota bacterium]|nr:hypothetical protein [Actinomycetota bacterium]
MLRAAARLAAVLLLAAPAVFVTATPCFACSCVLRTPKQLLHHADAAFVGTVVAEQPIDPTTTVQTFAVEGVFKGTLGASVNVTEPIGSGGGSICGVAYPRATRVAVVLSHQGDGWTTDSCSLVSLADLEAVAPPPLPPRAGPSPSSVPSVTPPPPEPSRGLGWPSAVLGLLVGVAGIALALSLGGRSGRARGTAASGSVEGEGGDEPQAEPPVEDPADRPRPTR